MNFLADILSYGQGLADASWNGVPFFMPDSRHETGRRVQRFFFPGQDETVFQDLGAMDGPMHVRGLMVGDRYVHFARQLEAALRTPGPGTLVHPWFGSLEMVLLRPATIVFSQRSMRVVSFEAVFAPYYPAVPGPVSTLDALLDQVDAAIAAGTAWLTAVLAPIAGSILLAQGVAGYVGALGTLWSGLTAPNVAGGALATAAASPLAALAGFSAVPLNAGYGAALGSLMAAVPQAVALASATVWTPAVGPGDAAAASVPVDGRVTLAALLSAGASAQTQMNASGAPGALALAQAAYCAVTAAQSATTVGWVSAQEAAAALAQLVAALDAVAAQAALVSAQAPMQAGLLWRALEALRATLIADMSATIGRLPPVLAYAIAAPLPVWVLANILAGDTPAQVLPTFADLVQRNQVRNPAVIGPGTIETLAQPAAAA